MRATEETSTLRRVVVCLACVRAKRAGRPWGCLVHVAEDVL